MNNNQEIEHDLQNNDQNVEYLKNQIESYQSQIESYQSQIKTLNTDIKKLKLSNIQNSSRDEELQDKIRNMSEKMSRNQDGNIKSSNNRIQNLKIKMNYH